MDAFAKMGVKLKPDTLEGLTDWMMGFLKLKGKMKDEPEAKIDSRDTTETRQCLWQCRKKEELLAEFYSARLETDESVTPWICRLESILGKSKERGLVQTKDIDEMLRSMHWTGLKDISGHMYDTIKTFDALRLAIRQTEGYYILRESSISYKTHTSKAATEVEEAPSEFEELKRMIHQLVNRMDTYEANKQTPPWQQQEQQQWQQQQQHQWQKQQPPNNSNHGMVKNNNRKVKDNGSATTLDNNHKGTAEIILSA
ncbi:Hypothetical predicted protein [Mytilus galloprovincialis]|uniref:Retrotransposon gag domain-containing protein n=1 Tax=Mytilus galloprovincialis TaxID=29158 RepID=A0A8B6G8F6_MYTGA|nr:Hypothetical predicted protein [Mytilus galloprovincialis]